jgi:sigma-B regulation protein RsbU (phosphoserine phosphatase)
MLSSENTTFDYLKSSSDFLNIVMNNISSCVLLLNKNMELQAFNDAMKTIFSNRPDEYLLYKKCGNAIGCAYAVEEAAECGKTSRCFNCELRKYAMISYSEKIPMFKNKISREFFTRDDLKVLKHLQFSTRPFEFERGNYIILIIEDITDLVNKELLIEIQEEKLNKLSSKN